MTRQAEEPEGRPQVPVDLVTEVLTEQATRTIEVLGCLKRGGIPLDGTTVAALDHIAQHLSEALSCGPSTD